MHVTVTAVKNVLTRATGYLKEVASHSAQPYRGCGFGGALCGAGCYVQHNAHVTAGRAWGEFLDVRDNAAGSYLENVERERRWAAKAGAPFGVFLSSSTDPFVPQEFRFRVTERLLGAMLEAPPDLLILQTHSHGVGEYVDLLRALGERTELRVHISIETDIESFPGLPPHASLVRSRFEAARRLRVAGLRTVITVAPLLPVERPERFFAAIADCADAVVIDHFIGGDGTATGSRTRRTSLPVAMAAVAPESVELAYRDRIVELAQKLMPGRVGVGADGFAGRYQSA